MTDHITHKSSILPLSVSGLSFSVRGQALIDTVSFELNAGSRTIILGPNGAGKSLLLRLCHGLLSPSAGAIRWSDGEVGKGGKRHAMVFQRPVLLRRSAHANITQALALAGHDFVARRQIADEALETFGLKNLARRYARNLSGGEQQRLALARVWALQPEVLFLDEPTAALDPAATDSIENIIQAFAEKGVKIVMTTHDLGQARRLSDEIMFLHRGRLLEKRSGTEFFKMPDSDVAKAFIKGELRW